MLEFAGAGAQALAWLHSVGGSSRTILEATDRYAAASVIEAIGFEPDHFTAPGVAQALAAAAFSRAQSLAAGETVVGLGCTATIATDRTKRGDHRCCLALYDGHNLTTATLTLQKGRRSRLEEEQVVSLLIINAIAEGCGLPPAPLPPLLPEEQLMRRSLLSAPIEQLQAGQTAWLSIAPDDSLKSGSVWPGLAILSGSFNPVHHGHLQMAQVVARLLARQVYFELPLLNADKGLVPPAEALRRRAQFTDTASLLMTTAPLFSQKARIFPDSVFIVGVDTATRLLQLRFYNDDPAQMRASFDQVRQHGGRFLVAGRLDADTGQFLTLADVAVPPDLQDLFEQIPEAEFRVDISSSTLRQRQIV